MTNTLDMTQTELRDINTTLQVAAKGQANEKYIITNPRGSHAMACGLDGPLDVTIQGSTGYYCAGMNKEAAITVKGSAGPGVAENMMSGTVNIKGNASSRCGISMKGIDIVVHGNIGHMSAFMAQKGNLVVLGNAGDALGDSLYEARLFVRGAVKSLGADCIEKEMRPEHIEILKELLEKAGADAKPEEFKRYGSARKLYNFNIDHADEY